MSVRLPPPRESAIQGAILEYLTVRGVAHWRVNQQGVPLHDGSNRFRPSPTRGVADILCCLTVKGIGVLVALEVKRPGGKPTEEQLAFGERLMLAGGFYDIVYSVEDADRALAAAEQQTLDRLREAA